MKKFELLGNFVFAALFAVITITCLAVAVSCEAWWHWYTLFLAAGLCYVVLVARDDDGDSVWKCIKEIFKDKPTDSE